LTYKWLVESENVEESSLPELTQDQIEYLSAIAEEAARQHVFSKVPAKFLETLNITVEAEGEKPITLAIEVELVLSSVMKDFDAGGLAEEAVKKAFESAEKYLRELRCLSQK
jgi:hypothetical protein